jgi:restriction system protein
MLAHAVPLVARRPVDLCRRKGRVISPTNYEMSIPSHEEAMLPVLQTLAADGKQSRRVLADKMASHFNLTTDERAQLLPSGKAPVIRSRTGWALTYLKQAGLISSPQRGWYPLCQYE